MSAPAVFLDRDGVLNDIVVADGRERPPWTLDELRFLPGVVAALDELRRFGYRLVAITNQPDVGRGDAAAEDVAAINHAVAEVLGLDGIYSCVHDGASRCDCRKPLPGMIHDAARALDIDLSRSWLVGDRWVDIAAGSAAGVSTVLVDRPSSWNPTSAGPPPSDLRPDATVNDLRDAIRIIVDAPSAS